MRMSALPPSPTLAISGYELTDDRDDPAAFIDGARAAAVDHVEVWHPRNTTQLGVERTLDALAESGLRFVCITTQTDLYRPTQVEASQQTVTEAIEIAARVD